MERWQLLIDVFLQMNTQLNLSAIRDAEWVYTKHIVDALELTTVLDLTSYPSLCDVGTGWGFPLLALAQELPSVTCVGIDARRKKIDAINSMIQRLSLDNCKAIWSRIEDHKQQYHIVTARAVAYADILIPRCMPLCRPWWLICLYKQADDAERLEIVRQCQHYNLHIQHEHQYTLYAGDIQRVIYVLQRR